MTPRAHLRPARDRVAVLAARLIAATSEVWAGRLGEASNGAAPTT